MSMYRPGHLDYVLVHVWKIRHNTFGLHYNLIHHVNTLRPRRNEQHFAYDIFKRIFFNKNVWFSIQISLKFVPKGPINNILTLVQIMAWRRSGDKPLSEPMMVSLPTHICVTRPQRVNAIFHKAHQHKRRTYFEVTKDIPTSCRN